jgi:hypothetical protein
VTKLKWDKGQDYEVGLDRGVFFPAESEGLAWNGLLQVDENVDEAETDFRYIDGIKFRTRTRRGEFSGSIEALTNPAQMYSAKLIKDAPRSFGLSYRVMTDKAYRIHLVYNVLLGPPSITWGQRDVSSYRWNFTTVPVEVFGALPSAHLVVDTGVAYSWTVAALEDVLYGTDSAAPRMPTPTEIFEIFEENAILRIIDHGDGTWTAIGPDSVVSMIDATTFEIDWPSANYIDAVTYTVSSL